MGLGKLRISSLRFLVPVQVLLMFLSSCTVHYPVNSYLEKSDCNQQTPYKYTRQDLPRPIHELEVDSLLLAHFSFQSLNVANAIGVLPILTEYTHKKLQLLPNSSVGEKVDLLELSLRLNQRIDIASLEISSAASEIDCEEERTGQIANLLAQLESTTESRLTVASIVIGASGAIAAGALINQGNLGDLMGIVSGAAEVTLGFFILLNKRKIDFYHKRNVLRDVWYGFETSEILPPSVWYYLNYFNPMQPDRPSMRYSIIDSWMNFGRISSSNSAKKRELIEVYFGKGGKYTTEQLNNRGDMLDQLESYIKLMKQDLQGLAFEMEQLK